MNSNSQTLQNFNEDVYKFCITQKICLIGGSEGNLILVDM